VVAPDAEDYAQLVKGDLRLRDCLLPFMRRENLASSRESNRFREQDLARKWSKESGASELSLMDAG